MHGVYNPCMTSDASFHLFALTETRGIFMCCVVFVSFNINTTCNLVLICGDLCHLFQPSAASWCQLLIFMLTVPVNHCTECKWEGSGLQSPCYICYSQTLYSTNIKTVLKIIETPFPKKEWLNTAMVKRKYTLCHA